MLKSYYLLFCSILLVCAQEDRFALNILHYNDFHARFVETSPNGGTCNPDDAPCIGGFGRLVTAIREGLEREPDSLLLNGGDSFQGTIWYNILRWNVTQEFMNMLPHDVHALGNHEFDNGVEGLVPYLKALNAPVVTANIIDDDEPTIQGLYEKSIVVTRGGRRIGIIGVLISSTDTLATTGQLKFLDEIETVKTEAEKLHEDGVDIIIVLSHCGYDIDSEMALHAGPYVDIIVGAHTHTLLYNDEVPENSGFVALGPYPTVVYEGENKRPVLIVTAAAHSQYLGEIKLHFDSAGNILDWEGNPHFMGNEIEQAADVLEKINHYLPQIEAKASEEMGTALVHLSNDCECSECNLGNLICDAFLHSVMDRAENGSWHYAHICAINQAGIRSSISAGVITYESVILSTPFENTIEVFELKGQYIKEMLEFSTTTISYPGARLLQVAGLQTKIDAALPENERVLDVKIRCIECDVPRYEPLDLEKYYRVVSISFLGNGGDGYTMLSEHRINPEIVGVDYDLLLRYIEQQTPVFAETEGRLQLTNACIE